jgi:hypothetical protein
MKGHNKIIGKGSYWKTQYCKPSSGKIYKATPFPANIMKESENGFEVIAGPASGIRLPIGHLEFTGSNWWFMVLFVALNWCFISNHCL